MLLNRIFSYFRGKGLKTLGDVDKLGIGEMGKHIQSELSNIDKIFYEQHGNRCRKCNGELEKIIPEITMSNLSLYECERCHERVYK